MATSATDKLAPRICRITDVVDEPLDIRAPVIGNLDLLETSLENAVEPLVSILPDVRKFVKAAKK